MSDSTLQSRVANFVQRLRAEPDAIEFVDAIALIDECYDYKPSRFRNGATINQAGQNAGACKILAFGRLNGLSEQELLACFGHYYRNDVRNHPGGQDHQNIRQFIEQGWQGVVFDSEPLTCKSA
jgi:hypothetical protein